MKKYSHGYLRLQAGADKAFWIKIYVNYSVFHRKHSTYKRQKPELSHATAINKEIADITVENSLFKRATRFLLYRDYHRYQTG